MKTNIYFVRHAEPDFSIKDDLIRPLSDKGIADTKKVTVALLDKNISIIYSSTFKRSVDTIKDFANYKGFDIITNQNFCERKVGKWVDDFKSYSKNQWSDFDYKLENGESLKEVQARNVSGLLEVIKNNCGKSVVIGTHGTALSTIINYFKPSFGYDDFWGIIDKMPYILCFKFDDGKFEGIEEIAV
jgi:2,3-bisphosphoglycerate-dependent phosphoglycerate mutase